MFQEKRTKKILAALTGLAALAAIAAWQFYLFTTFKNENGIVDVQGGTIHLGLAVGIALLVCLGGFFLFSKLVRYDGQNEMHITTQGHPLGVQRKTTL